MTIPLASPLVRTKFSAHHQLQALLTVSCVSRLPFGLARKCSAQERFSNCLAQNRQTTIGPTQHSRLLEGGASCARTACEVLRNMWSGEFESANDFPRGSRSAQLRWLSMSGGDDGRQQQQQWNHKDEKEFERATAAGRDSSRRMVHNARFLNNSLSTNKSRDQPAVLSPCGEVDVELLKQHIVQYFKQKDPDKLKDVDILLRQWKGREQKLHKFLMEAQGLPIHHNSSPPAAGTKLKIEIREAGVMGIRLEQVPGSMRPVVKAVTPRCEAAQQGLTRGYELRSVAGIHTKDTDYNQLLRMISSLPRPFSLKFRWPDDGASGIKTQLSLIHI